MRSLLAALALVTCACSAPPPTSAPTTITSHRETGLTFEVRGPKSAPYDAPSLGAGAGRTIALRIVNDSSRPASLARLAIGFAATRDGVAFPCVEGESIANERLPASVGPHASIEIDRTIACTTPLPGIYEIDVFTHDTRTGPRHVGHVQLELVAGAHAPRALEHGLSATLLGAKRTPPLSERAWNEGDYHVVLALINGGPRAVPLGPASLSFLVYKKGSPYPCQSEAKPLALPAELAPGSVYTESLPISCAPSEEGAYEVSGRFRLDDGGEVEIGRFALRVTRDPLLFTPLPLPPY